VTILLGLDPGTCSVEVGIATGSGIVMCFKLIEAAEGRWRRINAPELVALVRAGAKFVNGRLVERSDQGDAA
jgi:hypothetical protein